MAERRAVSDVLVVVNVAAARGGISRARARAARAHITARALRHNRGASTRTRIVGFADRTSFCTAALLATSLCAGARIVESGINGE